MCLSSAEIVAREVANQRTPPRFVASTSICLLGIMHAIGFLGFALHVPLFERLIPLHLLVSCAIWASNQSTWTRGLAVWLGLCGLLGYAAEIVGVRTALVFGKYEYGSTLGLQLCGVPLVMAANWALLTAVVGELSAIVGRAKRWGLVLRSSFGALLMVGLDFVMEPFAMVYDLWRWSNVSVPIQNYLGWAVLAFLMLVPYHWFNLRRENRCSAWLYGFQLAFFASLLPWTRVGS